MLNVVDALSLITSLAGEDACTDRIEQAWAAAHTLT